MQTLGTVDGLEKVNGLNGSIDARWRNVVKLSDHTRDLIIRNIQIEHSGDYELEINNSSTILHRKFHIAVSELPQSSHWKTAFAVVIGVVIGIVSVIAIGIGIRIWKGRINVFCSGKEGRTRENASKVREDVKQKDDSGTDKERDEMLKSDEDAQH
ncbi:hypothetical protein F2P79_023423 [Pimephales promelas]|nr:hypothetical protein F2P79_023423 [Pimephales promelas]